MKRRQGVGLVKASVRRSEGERFGIVFRSEREVESVSKELTRELRSATEAVYDPRLCGFPFTAESDDFRVGSDDMEQEGFAPEFTQFKMQVKQVGLETDQACSVCNVEVRVVRILPQRVKAAFANGFDLRLGYKGSEEAQVGRGKREWRSRGWMPTE